MRRMSVFAWVMIAVSAAGAAPLLAASEARAQTPLLDPGWQIYSGNQNSGVSSGFIARTFGDASGQYAYQPAPRYRAPGYAAPRYSAPTYSAPAYSAPAYYQQAPVQSRAHQSAPQYYAVAPSQAPGGYQQPMPQYYAVAPAQRAGAYQQPQPQPYYAAAAQQSGVYQPPAPQYYASAPAQQGRGLQSSPVYYQQPIAALPPGAYQPMPQPAATQPPQYNQLPPLLPPFFARVDWSPGYAPSSSGDMARPIVVDPKYDRQVVDYPNGQPPGTIIIDTPHYFLYLVLEGGKALRYGIGVGRPGFTWAGIKEVSAMREWPDWRPPDDMLRRRPDLPRFMPGGPENPLGARAIYLGSTLYRIHGSNEPWTIGTQVSSGCIRLRNEDVTDLYGRVKVGTKVIVI
jgi:lipoprotein-anchoring transpeptidase ErfK/SrfK